MLSEIIVQMMPAMNQTEGRGLEREMKKARTFDDPDAVLEACTEIVSGSADATIENARRDAGAMPEGAHREAALAAVAAMTPGGVVTPPTTGAPRRGAAAAPASAAPATAANESANDPSETSKHLAALHWSWHAAQNAQHPVRIGYFGPVSGQRLSESYF